MFERVSEGVTARANAVALLTLPDGKERLPELYGLAIGHEALDDLAGSIGFDLVHELHGFDNADDLALGNVIAG